MAHFSNTVYFSSDPEFIGKMPIRTELTVLEGDDIYALRRAIRGLLPVCSNEEIEAMYKRAYLETFAELVIES